MLNKNKNTKKTQLKIKTQVRGKKIMNVDLKIRRVQLMLIHIIVIYLCFS